MSEDSEDDDDSFQPVDGTRRILPANLMPPPNLPGRVDAFYVDSSDNELDEEKELPTLDMDESKDKAVAPKAVVIYHQDNQGVDMALVRYVPPDGVLPKSCSDHEMKRVITPEIVPRGAKACDNLDSQWNTFLTHDCAILQLVLLSNVSLLGFHGSPSFCCTFTPNIIPDSILGFLSKVVKCLWQFVRNKKVTCFCPTRNYLRCDNPFHLMI